MDWRGKLNYETLPKIKAWGVEVNREMMKIEARVLPAPAITYGGNKTLRAAFGFVTPSQPIVLERNADQCSAWNLRDIKVCTRTY